MLFGSNLGDRSTTDSVHGPEFASTQQFVATKIIQIHAVQWNTKYNGNSYYTHDNGYRLMWKRLWL